MPNFVILATEQRVVYGPNVKIRDEQMRKRLDTLNIMLSENDKTRSNKDSTISQVGK